jgi:hypothetical protein
MEPPTVALGLDGIKHSKFGIVIKSQMPHLPIFDYRLPTANWQALERCFNNNEQTLITHWTEHPISNIPLTLKFLFFTL